MRWGIVRRMRWAAETLTQRRWAAETLTQRRSLSSDEAENRRIVSLPLAQRLEGYENGILDMMEENILESPCNDMLIHSLRFLDFVLKASSYYRYEVPARYIILSRFLDFAQNHCPDLLQIFHTRIYLRSKSSDDSNDDLTKYQVIFRVLDVTKNYPKLKSAEVTEESQFQEDLGLDESESKDLKRALQVEFKLYIPEDESCKIHSCKLAIDYIYNHRMERLCMQDFWKKFAPEEPQSEWNLLLERRRLV